MTSKLPTCRTCLEKITEKEYPLIGKLVFNVDLNVASMLEFCISSKLDLSDDLPDSVCVACFKTIRIAYKFLQQVNECEKKLQENRLQEEYVTETDEDAEQNSDNADADYFLTCHDYAELDPNRSPTNKNEIEDDDNYEQDTAETSRDDVTNSIAEEFSNENIEIETIDEQKRTEDPTLSTNTPLVSYDCPVCDKQFAKANFFQVHVESHDLPIIKCTKCDVEPDFELEDYFTHYRDFHRYQCELCDKSLVTKSGYDYHMTLHTSSVRYKCTVKSCRRSYVTMALLKTHIQSHSITKVYPCHLCDSTFPHKDNLNYHLKQHENRRDHLCPKCGMAFFQAGALRIHLLRHTQTKCFVCEMCGKSFITNASLKKHNIACKRKRNKSDIKTSKK